MSDAGHGPRPHAEATIRRIVLLALAIAVGVLGLVALSGWIPALGGLVAAAPVVPAALVLVTTVVLAEVIRRR